MRGPARERAFRAVCGQAADLPPCIDVCVGHAALIRSTGDPEGRTTPRSELLCTLLKLGTVAAAYFHPNSRGCH